MSLLSKPEVKLPTPKVEAGEDVVIISFAFFKTNGLYTAMVLKTKGDRVIDKKVIESDDFRKVALDAADRATFEYWNRGEDPFAPPRPKGE